MTSAGTTTTGSEAVLEIVYVHIIRLNEAATLWWRRLGRGSLVCSRSVAAGRSGDGSVVLPRPFPGPARLEYRVPDVSADMIITLFVVCANK